MIRGCNRLGVGLGRHVRAIDQGRLERRRQWREMPGEEGRGKGKDRRGEVREVEGEEEDEGGRRWYGEEEASCATT